MTRRLLKTSNPISTMFASPVINVSAFHPQAIDTSAQACMGRREAPEPDRRFKPFIYAGIQCKNKAVQDSGGLCETCIKHKAQSFCWHGRVDEAPELMPVTSHIAGGPWFIKRRRSCLTDFQIIPNGRLMTAKQEGRLDAAPVIPERELMRFARGEVPLDIEYLSERRQISTQGLINILGALGADISRKVRFGSKAGLCAAIRSAMAGSPAEAQQNFNPEEDNYEEEAFEAEVQQMAYAGDEEGHYPNEQELNTAFYQPEEQEQEEGGAAQGGAAGGWLADEVEVEVEVQPKAKARRTLVPDWSQVPANAQVRWAFQIGKSHLTSYGHHVGEGQIRFGENISSNLAGFIKKELVIWKSLGRVPQDMNAPHNAWKALEFERNGAWARFDSIRTPVD